MTAIQPVPVVVLPAPFPTTADRVAGIYNAKAKVWADKEAEMAQSLYNISLVTYNNAMAANERAEAAEATRALAVQQTTAIKDAAVAETGVIRDQAIAARDAAAGSLVAAQGVAHYAGRWPDLSGALAAPASVWHAEHYWGLLGDLADVAAAEPGISAAWAAVGTQVHRLTYDERGQLRTLGYPGLEWALVEGLGMFAFTAGSMELDDDESCFAAAGGAWLLECPSFDLIDAWQLPQTEASAWDERRWPGRKLKGSGLCAITALTSLASATFTAAVPGARVKDSVLATPPGALGSTDADSARLSFHAYVSAPGVVTVRLTNASASAATSSAEIQAAWPVIVFQEI